MTLADAALVDARVCCGLVQHNASCNRFAPVHTLFQVGLCHAGVRVDVSSFLCRCNPPNRDDRATAVASHCWAGIAHVCDQQALPKRLSADCTLHFPFDCVGFRSPEYCCRSARGGQSRWAPRTFQRMTRRHLRKASTAAFSFLRYPYFCKLS